MTERDSELRQYLLGQLSEEQAARIEARFFTDETLAEELLAVEAELLDEHARGELPADAGARLVARAAGSERTRRLLTFARDLQAGLRRAPRRPWWRTAPVAAGVAAALAAGVAVLVLRPLRPPVTPPAPGSTMPAPPTVVAFPLLPQVRDGAAASPLVIPRSMALVRLELLVDGPVPAGSPTITVRGPGGNVDPDGPPRWYRRGGHDVLAVDLPAARLGPGRYRLTVADVGDYAFEISISP